MLASTKYPAVAHIARLVAGRTAIIQSIRGAISAAAHALRAAESGVGDLARVRPTRVLGALLIAALACSDSSDPVGGAKPVASIRVTPAERTLTVGQTFALGATPHAADGSPLSDRPVTWESLDQAVATVSAQGLVEAKAEGQVAITARSEGKEGRASITVAPTPVASVDLDVTELALVEGETRQLTATPRDAHGGELGGRAITWTSDNEDVATVSETGLVTAHGVGAAAVVATAEGKRASAAIGVSRAPVASVELDVESMALEEGESRHLTATPKDAAGRPLTGRLVQWSSSNPSVAVVSLDGLVIALRVGAATVTATAEDVSGAASVGVSLTTAYDLLFDGSGARAGGVVAPRLYTLDPRVPGAAPQPVFPVDGYTSDPTPSPDGTKIAFVAADGGSSNIYVANRDGTNLRQLTSTPDGEDQPAWSPDGTKIAFRRWAPGGPPGVLNPADVWVMNADGSGTVNLTNDASDTGSQQAPTWSPQLPDGSYRIAYASETRGPDGSTRARIYIVRADGGDKQAVDESGDTYDDQPAWSPDGSAIVFTRTGPAHDHQLLVVDLATRSERPLIGLDPAGPQYAPAWSPDGRLIAFVSNHEIDGDGSYEYQIYTVRADGTGLARRTFDDTEKQNPTWVRR